MRFVIGTVALLVLGSIFGSMLSVLFWPEVGAEPAPTASITVDTKQPPSWYR